MLVLTLPDETTLRIFSYLLPSDVLSAGRTCTKWQLLSKDDYLWRRFLHQRYPVDGTLSKYHVDCCHLVPALEVYRSIQEDVPLISVQHVKTREKSEILHFSFSSYGRFACSTSKNGRVCFWEVTASYRLNYLQEIHWPMDGGVTGNLYCFYSEFNEDDSLLLLCAGGIDQPKSCAIYVYDVASLPFHLVDSLPLPSDVYASWEDKTAFLFEEIEGKTDGVRMKVRRVDVTKSGFRIGATHRSTTLKLISDSRERLKNFRESGDRHAKGKGDRKLFTRGLKHFCPTQVGCCSSKSNGAPYSSQQRESIRASGREVTYVHARVSGIRLFAANQFRKIHMNEFPVSERTVTTVRSFKKIRKIYHCNQPVEVLMLQEKETSILVPKTECFFTFLDVNCKNYLASGTFDTTIGIWNRCSGALVATLEGHEKVVNAVAFNPVNDHMLVSVSDDGSLRVWHSKRLAKSQK